MANHMMIDELRTALERMRGADPETMEYELAKVRERNTALQEAMQRTVVSSSDDGSVHVEMSGTQEVVAITVDGRHSMRPSAQAVEAAVRQAWIAAMQSAAESVRITFRDEFGITIPEGEAQIQQAADQGRTEALQKLQPMLTNELLGGVFQKMMAEAEKITQATYTGTSGMATVTIDYPGQLVEIAIDQVLIRDADNITIGEDLLAAAQEARRSREEAQQKLGQAELPEELRPERQFEMAQNLIDGVKTRLRSQGV